MTYRGELLFTALLCLALSACKQRPVGDSPASRALRPVVEGASAARGIRPEVEGASAARKVSGLPVGKAAPSTGAGPAAPRAIRFRTFRYIDRKGMGLEAFRLIMPANWRFKGGIRWVLNRPGLPAEGRFTIKSPHGPEALEAFPAQPFFWTTSPLTRRLFPAGARYYGSEVRPPMGPVKALRKIVLKRFRRGVKGLRVVSAKALPDLARSLGLVNSSHRGVSSSARGAKIHIAYRRGGQRLEEVIFAVVQTHRFRLRSMTGWVTNTNWTVDFIFSFKAKKGELKRHAPTFKTMARSFRMNPRWLHKYIQLTTALIKGRIRHIRSMGRLSRMISRTSSQISEANLRAYRSRQKVYDRISANFSRYIRGVELYRPPGGAAPVELPSGYRKAWTNGLGDYIVSESQSFNPNRHSSQTWKVMQKGR